MLFMTQINKINYIFIKQIESKAENCVGDLADCKSYTSVVSWWLFAEVEETVWIQPGQN